MQGFNTYLAEPNHVSRIVCVRACVRAAAIHGAYNAISNVKSTVNFTLVISEVCVPSPLWLFSVVPRFRGFPV